MGLALARSRKTATASNVVTAVADLSSGGHTRYAPASMRRASESASEYRARIGDAAYSAEMDALTRQANQPQAQPPAQTQTWPPGSRASNPPPITFHTRGGSQTVQAPVPPPPRVAPPPPPPPRAKPRSVGAHHMELERQARSLLGMTDACGRTEEEVRRSFRKAVRHGKVHPDQGGDPVRWQGYQAASGYLCKLYAKAAELGVSAAPAPTNGNGVNGVNVNVNGAAAAGAGGGGPRAGAPRSPPPPSAPSGRRLSHETEMEYRARVAQGTQGTGGTP